MNLQEKELHAYATEYQNVLARLKQDVPPLKGIEGFLHTVEAHFSFTSLCTRQPKVIIAGSGFPEELVYAFGAAPYWVLGGSLQTGAWSGAQAPRDADPVSRSILGLLLGAETLTRDALILLPVINDSARKLAYLLRRAGKKRAYDRHPASQKQGVRRKI